MEIGSLSKEEQVKMRSHWVGVGPDSVRLCPYKKRELWTRDIQREEGHMGTGACVNKPRLTEAGSHHQKLGQAHGWILP